MILKEDTFILNKLRQIIMKLDSVIKKHKLFKISLITLLWIMMITIIIFFIFLILVDKNKWSNKEYITLLIFGVEFVILLLNILLINITYKSISNRCNKLINPNLFFLHGKDSYKIVNESNYKTSNAILFSNEIHHKDESFNVIISDVTFVKDEFNRKYAKLYKFETNQKFIQHFLLSRSLNISGFDKYNKESMGNTDIYYLEKDNVDVEKMNVSFTSNFYISFIDSNIYFIDFNKHIFDFEKEKLNDERFKYYIDKEIEVSKDIFKKLIQLS
jgi:hypothetical protein